MDRETFKDWVSKNLFTPKGKVNRHVKNKSWWTNRALEEKYKLLYQYTSWLPEESSYLERIYCILNDIRERPTCVECGGMVSFYKGKYATFCSRACSVRSESTKEKSKKTSIERYGVDIPNKADVNKQKIIKTMIERHGGFPFERKEIQEKVQETFLKKFGGTSPMADPQVRSKHATNVYEKYGVINCSQIDMDLEAIRALNDPEFLYDQHLVQCKTLTEIAVNLGVDTTTVLNYCRKYGIETKYHGKSYAEKELSEFISSLGVECITNDRDLISPYELDVIVPSKNLAIEFCGIYWHSDRFVDKRYHLEKLERVNEKGYRLLTIYSDEWDVKKNIVKKKIKSLLGIIENKVYARKCVIRSVDKDDVKKFLEDNHIQGSSGFKVSLGLYHDEELVAVALFKNRGGLVWELVRYATSCTVVGGFTKILSAFKNQFEWTRIISFADRRWSNGNLYEKSGFTLDKVLPPDYEYVKGNRRFHKFNFRHAKLKRIFDNYDPSLSERENCRNHGYDRIYNCGLLRYVLDNHHSS